MTKYIIESYRKLEDGTHIESTILGVYDTWKEALQPFDDACQEYAEDDENVDICLGIVREKDLLEPGDWGSYNRIEIIQSSEEPESAS